MNIVFREALPTDAAALLKHVQTVRSDREESVGQTETHTQ